MKADEIMERSIDDAEQTAEDFLFVVVLFER
jgi:hypothetical protein